MSSVKENKEEQIRLEVRRFFSETLMSLYASEGVPEHERTPRRQKEVVMKHYEEISARSCTRPLNFHSPGSERGQIVYRCKRLFYPKFKQ